jgi:2-polyprenyl-6-methoxyphenol hydroxylase-like FAD-dependent oxidoreductase
VLKHVEERDNGVRVVFEDGSTADGDFVVGCDGIHSRTRHFLDPQAPTPTYTGLIGCGGYATTDLAPTVDTQHFVFGKRAFFGYLVKPSGEAWWFDNHAYLGQPRRSELEQITQDQWRRKLMELHADDQPFISKLIDATTSAIGTYPIFEMSAVSSWHRGRCVIMGDAAHAASPSGGQGTSMALEDAIVLAQCMRDIDRIEEAFASFEGLRKARAERVVKFSRASGSNKVARNRVTRSLRDLVLPFVLPRLANTASLNWLYNYDVAWSARVAG